MDDFYRQTEPSGALNPPPNDPPTAVATSAPLPPRGPRTVTSRRGRGFRGLVDAALDGLDTLAERIATAAGLR